MTIVLHRHCRALGYCNRGLRAWFASEGLDWVAFLKHGIAADILRARENAMAERAIALAERESHGQQ
jgi:hypothetical protein